MDWMIQTWQQLPVIVQLAVKIGLILGPLILSVAYYTYMERKVIAYMHVRVGPNRVGPKGLLQPIADVVKLMFKEMIQPTKSDHYLFFIAPVLALAPALAAWAVIPFSDSLVLADIDASLLYVLALTSMGVYGVIVAGWASNSKYAFLGALRSAAQMVSYEVAIGFVIITVLLCAGSLNLSAIVEAQRGLWFCVPLLPMFVIFFISGLAETNRSPFDLPEAEAELVAGYNVEYSSMTFALFFLGEYANMILMSGMTTVLFLGGWLPIIDVAPFNWIPGVIWFGAKVAMCLFGFLWVRATFPRYRYDQLMRLGWKVFLPFSLFWVALTAGVLVAFDLVPRT